MSSNNTSLRYNGQSLSRIKNIKLVDCNTPIKEGEQLMMLEDGSVWERIFWHDVSSDATYFANEIEAKNCDKSNRYSNLINIANYIRPNGTFEFMLRYPLLSTTQYNRWIQRKNPLITNANQRQSQNSMEYFPIHIDWNQRWYYGLGLSSSSQSFMDCEAGHQNWFGSIGQYSAYNGGFPASDASIQKKVELWVRIDKVTNKFVTKNENIINIFNVEQYKNFVSLVNAAEDDFEGKTVNLYDDLDLSNETLESITIESFAGTFNGNFFKIKVPDTCPYLIDTNSGKILNLVTENSSTGFSGETEFFAGICNVNMSGTICNCCSSVKATVDGDCNCGGICTVNFNGTIEKCMFLGDITANTGRIGGIARQNSGTISDCIVGDNGGVITVYNAHLERTICWRSCL